MSEPNSKTIPLAVVDPEGPAVGVKQLGEDKIARSPVAFADAPTLRKPSWIRVRIPAGNAVAQPDRFQASPNTPGRPASIPNEASVNTGTSPAGTVNSGSLRRSTARKSLRQRSGVTVHST